jgi:hypothetical protein
VGKYEGKKILGRCRRRWVANSKMGPEEIGWEGATGLIWLRIGLL